MTTPASSTTYLLAGGGTAGHVNPLLAVADGLRARDAAASVLVLGTRDDMVVPVFHQEALASALPGCRKAIMETGGHLFPVSRPDIFTATVAEWIGALQ